MNETMNVTVFGKKKTTKEGKNFTAYVAQLNKVDGSTITASVKFREECGQPKLEECPINIIVEKEDANLAERNYVKDERTGEEATAYTLRISKWKRSPEAYVDHSLDEFE